MISLKMIKFSTRESSLVKLKKILCINVTVIENLLFFKIIKMYKLRKFNIYIYIYIYIDLILYIFVLNNLHILTLILAIYN